MAPCSSEEMLMPRVPEALFLEDVVIRVFLTLLRKSWIAEDGNEIAAGDVPCGVGVG